MTTNPIVFQILRDLGMPEDEAHSQLENNTLDLSGYGGIVGDDTVIAIAENCVGLTSIYLDGCEYITDAAVIAIAERYAGLTTINLDFCDNMTDTAVIALAESCAGLTTIALDSCENITDAAVIALAEGCAGLTSINLALCDNITDAAVIALAKGCAGLTWINLEGDQGDEDGNNITDTAVIALAEMCDYLKHCCCWGTKVSATGRQLIEDIKTRPNPPPLEEGWWMDDGTGHQCKGMMN
jgi:hypothetical protein